MMGPSQQQEVIFMNTDKIYAEAIVNEYSKKSASKVVALRKLDRAAKRPATIFTYTFGVLAALVAGLGMCLAMGVLGSGVPAMAAGIVVGTLGFVGMGVNYPIYKRMLEQRKAKYAGDIIRLASEISNETT